MTDLKDQERKASLRPTPRPPKLLPRTSTSTSSAAGNPDDDLPPRKNTSVTSPPPPKNLPSLPNHPVPPARGAAHVITSGKPPFMTPEDEDITSFPTSQRRELPRTVSQDESINSRPTPKQRLPRPPSSISPTPDYTPPVKPHRKITLPEPVTPQPRLPRGRLPTDPFSSSDEESSKTVSLPPMRALPREPSPLQENYDDLYLGPEDGGELYEDIEHVDVKYKPPRPPPILPQRNSEKEDLASSRRHQQNQQQMFSIDRTDSNGSPTRQRRESNAQKPNRAPPPPPPPVADYGDKEKDIVAPPRRYCPPPGAKSPEASMNEKELKKELAAVLRRQSATLPPGFTDIPKSPPKVIKIIALCFNTY